MPDSDGVWTKCSNAGRCDFCRHPRDDVTDITITDRSGGGAARICASCREFATTTRCGLCGAPKAETAKAEYLVWNEGKSCAPVCDACREKALLSAEDRA
jgi:formate dehydrogenase assembly factor FdhD